MTSGRIPRSGSPMEETAVPRLSNQRELARRNVWFGPEQTPTATGACMSTDSNRPRSSSTQARARSALMPYARLSASSTRSRTSSSSNASSSEA